MLQTPYRELMFKFLPQPSHATLMHNMTLEVHFGFSIEQMLQRYVDDRSFTLSKIVELW
jgi:hypothetical protein